jgi:hypothetical protein
MALQEMEMNELLYNWICFRGDEGEDKKGLWLNG